MTGRGAGLGSVAAPRPSRRRGDVLRAFVTALSLATATGASQAATLAEAQAAFDSEQFARAAELWRELARTGEPEAAFRLGLISDLGLGLAPDPDEAFGRYLEAAHRGHAMAQFNVGIMFDAGTGAPRSSSAAATWYARAASKGLARAEYNLALLHAEGDGVPRNIGLARAWMERAAFTLPAARERLETLRAQAPLVAARPAAPVPLAAAIVVGTDGERMLELVWTASEQPSGTHYRVELDGAGGGPGEWSAGWIEVSAVAIPLPSAEPRRWRVLATDGEQIVASDWQPLSGNDDERLSGDRAASVK